MKVLTNDCWRQVKFKGLETPLHCKPDIQQQGVVTTIITVRAPNTVHKLIYTNN